VTPEAARTSANVLLAVAAGAVAFAILRNPRWRRASVRLLRAGLTDALPKMVAQETRQAWAASRHGP
jgi:hypothetical protein